MPHIGIIGGTTFDHIIHLDSFPSPIPQTIHQAGFHEATGSTGAGKALCLHKLGLPCTLYSLLGNDVQGQHIIRNLQKEGVNFLYDIDPAGTERHVNIMDADGQRISIFVTRSTENPAFSLEKILEVINRSNLLVLNIISYCKKFIPHLAGFKGPVWTDLHDYTDGNPYHESFIEAADTVFLSSDNLKDYRFTMENLINRGKKLVVCTHGKSGSTALTPGGEWIHCPALSAHPLADSNGAGDNYFSGFLYAWLKGKDLLSCMQYGSICGALCIGSSELVWPELTADIMEKTFMKNYQ